MKRIIAVLLTIIFALSSPFSAFADIPATEIDPYLSNLFGMLYSPSDWGKDDSTRALLALSLYLDASVANKKLQDTFYVESLIKDAYLMRTGAGNENISYSLVILEDSDLLMIIFNPFAGTAEYSVTSNVSRAAFNKAVQGYKYWELDPQAVDWATDMLMEGLRS